MKPRRLTGRGPIRQVSYQLNRTEIEDSSLILRIASTEAGPAVAQHLGPDLEGGARPQIVVPPHRWQAAETTGNWTLVGCTVSPGFQFEGFELGAEGFEIPD